MSTRRGSVGSDEDISGTKIAPLDSEIKRGVPKDTSEHGVAGYNEDIDLARIAPLGGKGKYQHPMPHADTQGVTGRDEVLEGAKIPPMDAMMHKVAGHPKSEGIDDEEVDAARAAPLGKVREEML
ncbi:hypothetical protein H2199_008789 [Coniosporium tulheliwenetii]|uniref:Uncharacterized protein n=1 Tax=Coniosporium tulheliwenetii TaxID=3383036 RepID=A0ACC2YI66_9PEZI|nr:hypothetical protein H2199_008789 [Cladosporium sp. JES 115]